MKITYQLSLAAFGAALVLASCGGGKKEDPNAAKLREDSLMAAEKARQDSLAALNTVVDLVETAKGDARFSTFVELMTSAGLAETLSDANASFTLFIPTNEAFEAMDQKKLEALRTDLKKRQELTDLISYHVVNGNLTAADLGNYNELDAMGEKVIKLTRKDGSTHVGGAAIIETDIACSNGTIHVIGSVMTPPSSKGKAQAPSTSGTTTQETPPTTGTTSTGRGGNQDAGTTSTGRGGNQDAGTTSTGRGGNN